MRGIEEIERLGERYRGEIGERERRREIEGEKQGEETYILKNYI